MANRKRQILLLAILDISITGAWGYAIWTLFKMATEI